jgi:glycoprotein endo-alpha-1,2-mannosidase
MRQRTIGLLIVLLLVALACVTPTVTEAPVVTGTPVVTSVPTTTLTEPVVIPTATGAPTTTPSPSPTPTLPPAVGPDPSLRVAIFYYPWYRTPEVDGYWDHWNGAFRPPLDIASDYYPTLGAYSVGAPAVLAQHFAWLREAGVGVIISSWWGQRSREDQAVPLLLDVAEYYGIKVAFHIEPYGGRTADRLVDDVRYLYTQYGDHPAFYRSTASSRWSPDARSKGLFFVWAITVPDHDSPAVGPGYWQGAVDAIHALPDGGLVIANATEGYWVDGGHFDGLYNYATLHLDKSSFSWARTLPPDAWYIPSVLPGFSARRIGYPPEDHVDRKDGATYEEQWEAALGAGVEPAMVTITSFNEWHEGTQIEPAAVGATHGLGYTYDDYGPLPPDAYLTLTRQLADQFLAMTWPETYRARIRVVTTSDWTTFGLVSGATWLRPSLVSASEEATRAWFEGDDLALIQPVARAEAGGEVEMVVDILFANCESGGTLVFEIERGHLGSTQVELFNYLGTEPVVVGTFVWDGINPGERNATTVQIPADKLVAPVP